MHINMSINFEESAFLVLSLYIYMMVRFDDQDTK